MRTGREAGPDNRHEDVNMNPLLQLRQLGQSLWVDDIRRVWLADGTVRRWIDEDGIAGITSNPAIFEKAISGGDEYREAIARLARQGVTAMQAYETLALEDVRAAADLFAPLHTQSGGQDGFVSLEVSPLLADDTQGTVREARRLWQAFDRPNAMIKVPATAAGLPAIRQLIAEGINVNITLIFGLPRYEAVVDAFLAGLEQRRDSGLSVQVASVASFFISRIDTAVDARLDALATPEAQALRGTVAIASARQAYRLYKAWTGSARWQRIAAHGASPQRLLWASTSTKDPAYDELKYVETLAGPQTVNTLPPATIAAYRKRGRPAPLLESDADASQSSLRRLHEMGIDAGEISTQLEREGVRKFVEPFDRLLAALDGQLGQAGRAGHAASDTSGAP